MELRSPTVDFEERRKRRRKAKKKGIFWTELKVRDKAC
jgi:hypothetical protein